MQQATPHLRIHETVEVVDSWRRSLGFNAALCASGVTLCREISSPGTTYYSREAQVLQILVTLVRTAKYPATGPGKTEKLIILRIARRRGVASRQSTIGSAIPAENRTACSPMAFPRRPWHGFACTAVLAPRSSEGPLRAESDGIGACAAFILELPSRDGTSQCLISNPPAAASLSSMTAAIHHAFRKVPRRPGRSVRRKQLDRLEAGLFGTRSSTAVRPNAR